MDYRQKIDELSSSKIRRVFRGFDTNEVLQAFREWQGLSRELLQRNELLAAELAKSQETETIMRKTILHADKIATAIQDQANTEAANTKAKAEQEVATIVEQARKKAEAQERALIDRRTILERKMDLYEHESNLLLYRFYDLAKYHLDELGQEVSTEVKSLLQRLGTDWEMIPQLPFPFMEGKEARHPQAEEAILHEMQQERSYPEQTPEPTSPGETPEKVDEPARQSVEEATTTVVSQEAHPPPPPFKRETESQPPSVLAEGSLTAGITPEPGAIAMESAPETTIPPQVSPPVPAIEPVQQVPAPPRSSRFDWKAEGSAPEPAEKSPEAISVEPPIPLRKPEGAKATPAEELRRVEEALLCGRRLIRDVRDSQGRLVVGQGTKVTREMIHFLIGKSLYGELLASVSDDNEGAEGQSPR
jgi:hypothetical protein